MDQKDTLEHRLKQKLESGELSLEEYKELFDKFQKLGLLDAIPGSAKTETFRSSLMVTGRRAFDTSLEVDGAVTVAGTLKVEGDLHCTKLAIAGSGEISGQVLVSGKMSVNGKLHVERSMKIQGDSSITGKCSCLDNLVIVGNCNVAGKLNVDGTVSVGNRLGILGKVSCSRLECAGRIKLSGKLHTAEDVVCEEFFAPLVNRSAIGGNLIAKKIQIGHHGYEFGKRSIKADEFTGDIVEFVMEVVDTILWQKKAETKHQFRIQGSVRGETIQISGIRVEGDVVGDRITIGPNTIVGGTVLYKETISVSEDVKDRLTIKKLD